MVEGRFKIVKNNYYRAVKKQVYIAQGYKLEFMCTESQKWPKRSIKLYLQDLYVVKFQKSPKRSVNLQARIHLYKISEMAQT